MFWVWLVGLIGSALISSMLVQRVMSRFVPLTFLFNLSLVFPDRAPSRFKTAMRSMSGKTLERRINEGNADVSDHQASAEEMVALLARLSRHDRVTRGHSERVRAYSVMLGEEIGLSPDELERLNWAALIHDIGKLEVPYEVLNKKGRPNDTEWEMLRRHPGAGASYIERLRPWLGDWVDAATQHHERWDGTGYPNGLKGTEISLADRLVAVADAYDVMTSPRSYKPPLPPSRLAPSCSRTLDRNSIPTWSGPSCRFHWAAPTGCWGQSDGPRIFLRSCKRQPQRSPHPPPDWWLPGPLLSRRPAAEWPPWSPSLRSTQPRLSARLRK